ncbi:MAG: tetratricopeptide repeat protein [Ferruginibacter sp.]|nr:tetratricopeptide repeat protein [Ferruginibacter sp.]
MKKQLILAAAGILSVIFLFIFGRTSEPKKAPITNPSGAGISSFNIEKFIDTAKAKLPPSQILYVSSLENSVKRGDVQSQQIMAYSSLAKFWKDSIQLFEPYAFYISEAAKLDNSEKNLTFAARLFLDNLRGEHDEPKLSWETTEAITLFERAIKLNPDNDDLRIGLGSCYVYGKGRNGDPQETMKGIQELLAVVRKDSNNMKAQLVLAIGGVVSGQYDKALERLQKIIAREPNNFEAIAFLADTYAAKGEKEQAIKWYTILKRIVSNDPRSVKEIDNRIKMLK